MHGNFVIDGADGHALLIIHNDGIVTGAIEDAGEAAAVFVRELRGLIAGQRADALAAQSELIAELQVDRDKLNAIRAWNTLTNGRPRYREIHELAHGIDTDTHWANGTRRLLTPEAFERMKSRLAEGEAQ
jgi:hypothetical protein